MKTYQFLSKDAVVIHLEVGTETFQTEQAQLLEQGFELSGQALEAESLQVAYRLHQETHGAGESEYPLLGTLSDVPQAIALRAILGG
ncbi:hypothetical protein G5S52_09735 [Grimontia sp. S25]|uniref:Uncharacterized protein n=1 Tax=Grimontia sedimenti TaxID=2711294 RepID=A0A6M1R6C4_9GAMM|nr:hypothetical protein [Grimontia sedimenti]NGN97925.1 hypothetical protein [Grimontia sedimenti]